MPLDPSILEHYDPVMTAGRMMANQNVASEIAMRNAQQTLIPGQVRGQELENQQRQIALDDDKAMRLWMQDPKNQYAFGKGDLTGLAGQISPSTFVKLQSNLVEAQKAHAELGKDQLALHDATLKDLQNGFDGLMQMPSDEQRASAWPALVQQWRGLGYLKDVNVPPSISGSKDELNQIAVPLQIAKGLNDAAIERASKQAETSKNTAAAAKDTTEAAKNQMELDWAKQTPDQMAARVGMVVDPKQYPTLFQTALGEYMNSPTLAGKQQVLTKYGDRVAELDPDVMKAKRKNAVQQAVDTEMEKARLAGGPLATVFDPSMRNKSETQMQQDIKALNDTFSDAERFQNTVNLALAGNQNAPGMLGPEEMRQVLNRVNTVELNAIGKGAGSAWQRVQGWLGSWTAGQPIPPQILNDMKQVSDSFKDAARNKFRRAVGLNNQVTPGAKWNPDDMLKIVDPTAAQPAAIPSAVQTVLKDAKPGIHTLSDGTKWMKSADGTISQQ